MKSSDLSDDHSSNIFFYPEGAVVPTVESAGAQLPFFYIAAVATIPEYLCRETS